MIRSYFENKPYLIASIALALLVLFFHLLTPWAMEDDYWETSATVREIARNPLHPQNPLLALGEGTSPRIVPYTLLWGSVMRLTSLPLPATMILAALVNILMLTSGLYRFVSQKFKNDRLPLYVLLTMLLLWGAGYSQANAYQLEILVWSAPYVGIAAFAICFHALAGLQRFLDLRSWYGLSEYTLLSIVVFLTHPITAAFLFVAALALLFESRSLKLIVLLQVVPLLCLAVALVWPFFDYWTVLTKGSSEAWFVSPMFSNRPAAIGTAFVGIPILAYFVYRRRVSFLAYGFAMCAAAYLASDILDVLIGGRFLFWAMVFLHIGIALYVLETNLIRPSSIIESLRGSGLSFVLLVMLLLPALAYRAGKLGFYGKLALSHTVSGPNYLRMPDALYFLSQYLGATDVVMADERSAWVLPSLTGAKIIAQAKGNPLIQGEVEKRKLDVQAFYRRELSVDERRKLLNTYGATHVLVNRADSDLLSPSLFQAMDSLAELSARQSAVELYRIR